MSFTHTPMCHKKTKKISTSFNFIIKNEVESNKNKYYVEKANNTIFDFSKFKKIKNKFFFC